MPAHPAGNEARIASSVEKKHALLSSFQPVLQKSAKPSRKNGTVTFLELLSQILHINHRKLTPSKAFIQGKQPVASLPGPVIAVQGRGCGA